MIFYHCIHNYYHPSYSDSFATYCVADRHPLTRFFVFRDEVFYDIELETNENGIVFDHKMVLASACLYFYSMFIHFTENNHDLVVMR